MKKQEIKKTGEFVYTEKLANGLSIIMVPNYRVKNFYITLTTKFGSIHTDFKYDGKQYKLPKGTAHFLEHLMFNMPNNENAFDYYSNLGSNINAFTSYELTAYEVFANSRFKENLSYLLEYVYTPYFTKELVNAEKGIITEETKMVLDNPNSEVVYGMYRNVFHNDEHQYLITGEVEDVKSMTLDDINAAYEAFYHPENMFLIVTGNFNPEEVIAISEEVTSKKDFSKYIAPEIKKIKEPSKVKNPFFEKEMNVDKPKVTLAIKIPKTNFKSLKLSDLELQLYINLIIRINYGETSLLKEELLTSSIITDQINTFLTTTEEYFVQTIMASSSYPDYFIKRVNEKWKALTVNQDEINRKIKSSISNLIMSFDEIEVINNDIQEDIINYGRYITEAYTLYRNLNTETAMKVLEKLKRNEISISIIKPKSSK